jgi:4-aminobutyrate aminotransferase-like enzyme
MIAPVGHYGNVLRLAPPLVINEEQLNTALDILDNAFKACQGSAHTADTLETSVDRTD